MARNETARREKRLADLRLDRDMAQHRKDRRIYRDNYEFYKRPKPLRQRATTLNMGRFTVKVEDGAKRFGTDASDYAYECFDRDGALVGHIAKHYGWGGDGHYQFHANADHAIASAMNPYSATRKRWVVQDAKREFAKAVKGQAMEKAA